MALVLLGATLSLARTQEPAPVRYFPRGSFSNNAASDDVRQESYARCLAGMGEPSLFAMKGTSPSPVIYRFTMLPSFSSPASIRLTVHPDGSGELIVRKGALPNSENPSAILSRDERLRVSAARVDQILLALTQGSFWSLPPDGEKQGIDGSQWIIEGLKEGRYHVTDRWCPDALRNSGYVAIGNAFLHLAKEQ